MVDVIPGRKDNEGKWSIDERIIVSVMGALALLAPLGLSVSSDLSGEFSVQVFAVTWGLLWYFDIPLFVLGGSIFTLFGVLRLLFAYQMYKCYRLQTSRRRAVQWGIASELQNVILFIPYLFLTDQPLYLVPIMVPIPLLLMIGLLFLFITPPRKHPSQWPQTVTALT